MVQPKWDEVQKGQVLGCLGLGDQLNNTPTYHSSIEKQWRNKTQEPARFLNNSFIPVKN